DTEPTSFNYSNNHGANLPRPIYLLVPSSYTAHRTSHCYCSNDHETNLTHPIHCLVPPSYAVYPLSYYSCPFRPGSVSLGIPVFQCHSGFDHLRSTPRPPIPNSPRCHCNKPYSNSFHHASRYSDDIIEEIHQKRCEILALMKVIANIQSGGPNDSAT
ncbi:hypothetical protein BZA77DRAFT_366534, partial [Pyronema omphalodes]